MKSDTETAGKLVKETSQPEKIKEKSSEEIIESEISVNVKPDTGAVDKLVKEHCQSNHKAETDIMNDNLFQNLKDISPAGDMKCSKCKSTEAYVKFKCQHAFCMNCLALSGILCEVPKCTERVPRKEIQQIIDRLEAAILKDSTGVTSQETEIKVTANTKFSGSGTKIKGVYNLGMTCYANSIFQVLGQTRDFIDNLQTLIIENRSGNLQLTDNLMVLLVQLNDASQTHAVDVTVLQQLLNNIFSLDKNFRRYEQSDCFEFLNSLFEKLESENEHTTSIFKLQTQTILAFKPCNDFQLCQTQNAKSLVIPMSKDEKSVYSVRAGLKSLLDETETFEKGILPCKQCNKSTKETIQSFILHKTPKILILYISRVKAQQSFFKKYLEKQDNFVEYGPFLEIPETYKVDNELHEHIYRYRLYGVVLHSGSVHGGHYYSYVNKLDTNQWFLCNDTSVRKIDECDVFKSRNAYMLFYEKGPRLRKNVSDKSDICSLM